MRFYTDKPPGHNHYGRFVLNYYGGAGAIVHLERVEQMLENAGKPPKGCQWVLDYTQGHPTDMPKLSFRRKPPIMKRLTKWFTRGYWYG